MLRICTSENCTLSIYCTVTVSIFSILVCKVEVCFYYPRVLSLCVYVHVCLSVTKPSDFIWRLSLLPTSYTRSNIALLVSPDMGVISAFRRSRARSPGNSCIKSGIISKRLGVCQYIRRLMNIDQYRGSNRLAVPSRKSQAGAANTRVTGFMKLNPNAPSSEDYALRKGHKASPFCSLLAGGLPGSSMTPICPLIDFHHTWCCIIL